MEEEAKEVERWGVGGRTRTRRRNGEIRTRRKQMKKNNDEEKEEKKW